MIPISILDLAPILEGGTAGDALANTLDLARHAETWGYRRFWLAEHHNMPGIASAATAVVIGHVAAGTSSIRVGAGGIMLPNHAPLVVAEQFGTLATLYPGRIDLGLGRAPGTDQLAVRALRRNQQSDPDQFPRDVMDVMAFFRPEEPRQRIRAVPGAGVDVPVWILGSSLFGAHLAAALGLPYAFASHFAPGQMMEAIAEYRQRFQPSEHLSEPYVMLGFNVFAADTEDEARYLMSSMQQAFIKLRKGDPGRLPPPVKDFDTHIGPAEREMLDQALACSAVGPPETVRRDMAAFLEKTGADELILTAQIYDHAARLRAFEIAAEARDALSRTA